MKGLDWKPEVLVLGPGGMKGFLELGALLYLEKIGLLDDVTTYVGCSVGSVICLLKVCGYSAEEILKEAITVSVFDFVNISVKNIGRTMGLVDTAKIRAKIELMVKKKYGIVPTLEQLYKVTGKILTVVTCNMSKVAPEYINRDNRPNMSCVEAVMLSSNIPLLFQQATFGGSIYADGALSNPYPIDVYDDGKTDILGIYITSLGAIGDDSTSYLWKIAQCSINEIATRIRDACSDRCKHIILESPTMDTTGLSFTSEVKGSLVMQGWLKSKEFTKGIGIVEEESMSKTCLKNMVDDAGKIFYEEVEEDPLPEPVIKDGIIMIPVTPRVREILKNTGLI